MEDDEVADAFELQDHLAIVFVAVGGLDVAGREERDEAGDAGLDEVDGGGFQGFQEAGCQAQRDDIAVPELFAAAGDKADDARIGEGVAFQIFQEDLGGAVLAHMGAGENMAVAGAVL